MSVTREEVLRIAELARLRLSADDVGRMTAELNSILRHVEELGELDLEGVAAMGLAAEWEAPLRADVPGADRLMVPIEQLAPAAAEGFFTVPRLAALDHTAGIEKPKEVGSTSEPVARAAVDRGSAEP
jgi:aspartyl-tRNA(Asn)/glutamyl-tRNA(Gln) amidotransferase subunit C